jgi:hypothetical protein
MLAEMREDLTRLDPTTLWWAMAHTWSHNNSKHELATALAAAMMRLAQQQPREN